MSHIPAWIDNLITCAGCENIRFIKREKPKDIIFTLIFTLLKIWGNRDCRQCNSTPF